MFSFGKGQKTTRKLMVFGTFQSKWMKFELFLVGTINLKKKIDGDEVL